MILLERSFNSSKNRRIQFFDGAFVGVGVYSRDRQGVSLACEREAKTGEEKGDSRTL